jgi:hypothetical protein
VHIAPALQDQQLTISAMLIIQKEIIFHWMYIYHVQGYEISEFQLK